MSSRPRDPQPESGQVEHSVDPRQRALERTVESFLRHITFERGLSENTVAAYRRDLATYTAWVVGHQRGDFGSLTESNVSDYVGALASKTTEEGAVSLTPSSIARMLSSVRSLHRFLLSEGLVDEDVTRDLTPPKKSQRLPKAITVEQMGILLGAVAGDDPIAVRDRAILELLYATGARVSELTGLTVDDLLAVGEDTGEGDDAAVNLIRVVGKGSKQRIVPFGSYAKAALDAYLVRSRPVLAARGMGTPSLFLGSRGAPLSRQSVWLVIQSAAEAANLGVELSPHTFRHSFATHLLQGGADVRTVQELLGHSSVATTQIYTLVTADTLRDMYVTAHPRAR